MPNIRQIILDRLDHLGRNRAWLAEEAAKKHEACNRHTVFRYLRGDRDTSASVAGVLLEIVGGRVEFSRRSTRKNL